MWAPRRERDQETLIEEAHREIFRDQPFILGVPNDGEMVTPLTKRGYKVARNLYDLGYIQKSKAGDGIFPVTSIKGIFVGWTKEIF